MSMRFWATLSSDAACEAGISTDHSATTTAAIEDASSGRLCPPRAMPLSCLSRGSGSCSRPRVVGPVDGAGCGRSVMVGFGSGFSEVPVFRVQPATLELQSRPWLPSRTRFIVRCVRVGRRR
jgi:hypothetical protein